MSQLRPQHSRNRRLPLHWIWLLSLLLVHQGCKSQPASDDEFVHEIPSQEVFDRLKGEPLSAKYGQVESIKLVLDLRTEKLYYISSRHYKMHFDFCQARLGFWQSLYLFNDANYSTSSHRRFALANLNHYLAQDWWTLEFSSVDLISPELILELRKRVVATTFVGERVAVFLGTQRLQEAFAAAPGKASVPVITPAQVYGGLEYQALNCRVGVGFLRRVRVDSLEALPPGPRDIVVLDGPALDIPAVAGLLSPDFQTPLSHLNVLCKNRQTAFAAQKGVWDDPRILALEDKLVRLEVFQDSFTVRGATLDEAQRYWNQQRPAKVQHLALNVKKAELQEMKDLNLNSVAIVGGKAANFSILARLAASSGGKFRVPEGAFAIPFYWYWQHFRDCGAAAAADSLLAQPEVISDSKQLAMRLARIRALIEAWPVNPKLINMIASHTLATSPTTRMRFRSSTNAEDIEGFNGAGLYESRSGIVGDTAKTVENALREVWASLWNYRAFQEREFFRIDHRQCAMGILVHRSFPEERANGVAITKNLYRSDFYGFVINVQQGEVSVVSPPPGVTCDQLICYSDADLDFFKDKEIVEYITQSSLTNGKPVLTNAQVVLLTEQLSRIKKHYYGARRGYLPQDIYGNQTDDYNNFALDVEFKFDGPDNQLYIKQVRPYND